MPDRLEELQCSNEYLNDLDFLKHRFQQDGYLFFRRILDVKQVESVKRDFVQILQAQGIVKAECTEPVWTGLPLEQIDDNPLYRLKSYDQIMESEAMLDLLKRIFGGPVFRYRNTDIRFALPNDERHLTPPHQDHFYIRETDGFRTAWIPLMSIGQDAGGLAIANRSQRRGLLEHVEHERAHSYIFRGRKQRGVPLENVDDQWLTAAYAPGDVLLFHSMTIHRALPNTSDRIRLSLDARFQSVSAPRTWQSEKTILELRQYRHDVHRLAVEKGASEPVFETLLIEMMKRGLEPKAHAVAALMFDLSAGQEPTTEGRHV